MEVRKQSALRDIIPNTVKGLKQLADVEEYWTDQRLRLRKMQAFSAQLGRQKPAVG